MLGLAEALARRLLPAVPGGLEDNRNPYRFRGWPEFIRDVGRGPKGATVVLISNSQAYAGEHPGKTDYPARLEESAERTPGGRPRGLAGAQLVVRRHDLDRIRAVGPLPAAPSAVAGARDDRVRGLQPRTCHRGFFHCRTDLPRLVSRPAILRGLPRSYLKRHSRVEDDLAFAVYDRLALYRFKEYFWSWLDVRLPGIHGLFYAPAVNYRPWELKGRPWLPPMELPKAAGRRNPVHLR